MNEVFQPETKVTPHRVDKKEYLRQWHIKNKERRRLEGLARRHANPEKYREMARKSREKNKASLSAYQRQWGRENVDKRRAACKRWYYSHLEAARERSKLYRREAYRTNPEKMNAATRKWMQAHPWVRIGGDAKRRALLKTSDENWTLIKRWTLKMRKKSKVRCYYCGKQIEGRKIHFDHIVPLSRGGPNSVENMCCACHPCNASKHAKLPSEWDRIGQLTMDI